MKHIKGRAAEICSQYEFLVAQLLPTRNNVRRSWGDVIRGLDLGYSTVPSFQRRYNKKSLPSFFNQLNERNKNLANFVPATKCSEDVPLLSVYSIYTLSEKEETNTQ